VRPGLGALWATFTGASTIEAIAERCETLRRDVGSTPEERRLASYVLDAIDELAVDPTSPSSSDELVQHILRTPPQ
jgi:hypothetical protein